MLPTNNILDELNPDLQRYMLWWKRAACLAQFTLVLAAGLSVQLHGAVLLQAESPLVIGLRIGAFYSAAAVAQLASLLPKRFRSRLMGLVAEVLLCLACGWNALASGNAYLTVRLFAGGLTVGFSLSVRLCEWNGIEQRYGSSGNCLMTACVGIALGIALLPIEGLLRLMPDTPLAVYVYTCCAVFAVGIRLKFQEQEFPLDFANLLRKAYIPIRQMARIDRLILAMRILSFAVLGALMVFSFPYIKGVAASLPFLWTIGFFCRMPVTAHPHSILVLGCVLSVLGIAALFGPAVWFVAFFSGMYLVMWDLEKDENRLPAILICGSILAGIVIASIALALS